MKMEQNPSTCVGKTPGSHRCCHKGLVCVLHCLQPERAPFSALRQRGRPSGDLRPHRPRRPGESTTKREASRCPTSDDTGPRHRSSTATMWKQARGPGEPNAAPGDAPQRDDRLLAEEGDENTQRAKTAPSVNGAGKAGHVVQKKKMKLNSKLINDLNVRPKT